jgi:voltage-gated potassium channel
MATVQGGPPSPPSQHPRAWKLLMNKPLTARRAARIIALAIIAVTLVGGVAIHFADQKNFPDIGDGLWWSIQTVTTVGYGDQVPTDAIGRLVASAVMLTGIGFLTVITATVTSTLIEAARQRVEGSRSDALSAKRADQRASGPDRGGAEGRGPTRPRW